MTDDSHAAPIVPAAAGDQTNPLRKIEQLAPKGWRIKLAKAAAQLIAGSEKGAIAYGEIRERLDTIEGRSIVSKGLAAAVLQQEMNDPEMMERAKARFLGSALQKQENLEAVILGAAEPPLALPAPSDEAAAPSAAESETGRGEAASQAATSSEQPLNADWAATFAGVAENATSDELRGRLSRVLAGELASPGAYSRATVRQIAELEQADLEAMQRVLSYVVGDLVVRLERGDTQEPSIDMLLPLAEAGLIAEANSMLSKSWPPASADGTEIWFGGKVWAIKITLKMGQSFNVPMTQLTRTGIAVVDLLGRPDEESILKRFVDGLDAATYSTVGLGRLISSGQVALPLKQLKPAPAVSTIPTSGPFSSSPPPVP